MPKTLATATVDRLLHHAHVCQTSGADGQWGSGLQGLVDRLATSGGHLTVSSPVGRGTGLQAVIPCT